MVKISCWLLFPFLKYSKKFIGDVIRLVKCTSIMDTICTRTLFESKRKTVTYTSWQVRVPFVRKDTVSYSFIIIIMLFSLGLDKIVCKISFLTKDSCKSYVLSLMGRSMLELGLNNQFLEILTFPSVFPPYSQLYWPSRKVLGLHTSYNKICNTKFRSANLQICYVWIIRIRIRIVYWWNAETTITHQDLWLGN